MFEFSTSELSLVYFTADPVKASAVLLAGADAILVDCEYINKYDRQVGFDTEINHNKPEQIKYVRAMNPSAHIMCRVNNDFGGTTESQIEAAIVCGANSIILPMVESIDHIKQANDIINQRISLVIMIESQIGVANLVSLAGQRFDAIYVGLNDLSISRGGRPLFEPLYDGTVEKIILESNVTVGVGGVTDPSMGSSIKSVEIVKQYARLGVKFSILRRSFEQAITQIPADTVISNIKTCYADYQRKDAAEKKKVGV